MSSSSANSGINTVPMLNGRNYQEWSSKMKAYLMFSRLWPIVLQGRFCDEIMACRIVRMGGTFGLLLNQRHPPAQMKGDRHYHHRHHHPNHYTLIQQLYDFNEH